MYLDLVNRVSLKFNDRIKQACKPLFDCFNLNHFWYYKIRNDGRFAFFDNNISWSEYYSGNKLYLTHPYLRDPKLLRQGVYVLRHPAAVGLFSPGFNSEFQMVNRIADGIEAFGFSSFSAADFQMTLFMNEMGLLRLFAKQFREQNRMIFHALEDNLIDLSALMGPLFRKNDVTGLLDVGLREIFLGKIGIDVGASFSAMEIEVVKRLLRGYSASQIGMEIGRSKRTVEHRIERLKEKTTSFSKSDLLKKCRELEGFGYLSLD